MNTDIVVSTDFQKLDITIDRSVNVWEIPDTVVRELNAFMEKQHEILRGCFLTFMLFGNEYQLVRSDVPLGMVKGIDHNTWVVFRHAR